MRCRAAVRRAAIRKFTTLKVTRVSPPSVSPPPFRHPPILYSPSAASAPRSRPTTVRQGNGGLLNYTRHTSAFIKYRYIREKKYGRTESGEIAPLRAPISHQGAD